jgi:hypothetical protein
MMMFLGCPPSAFRRVGDIVQRIGAAHVGVRLSSSKSSSSVFGIVDHVLDHGAELRGGGVDLRLGLGAQVDRLGVAAALEVEGAAIGPAMLVIADQDAVGIGRQRRLAGARQAEEHGRVHRVARRVVGRAVHRHDALFGQQVVQQREHRFLVLARVFGAADQDQLACRSSARSPSRTGSRGGRVGLEAGAVDDGEIGHEAVQLLALGRRSMWRMNSPCQASSVTMRTLIACAGSAPPKRSCTK